MNILFYIILALLIGVAVGFVLPRLAIIAGLLLIAMFVVALGINLWDEFGPRPPHDTSVSGMLVTIAAVTILPLGVALLASGAARNR